MILPVIRYGIGFSSATVLIFIVFALLDGTIRRLVVGFAIVEIVVVPQILKRREKTALNWRE